MSDPRKTRWKIQRIREQHSGSEPGPQQQRNGFFVPLPSSALALAVLGVIAIGVGVLIWQMWPKDPADDSAEAGFLRDMFTHHSQAVEMAMIIRDRTEDPELFAMATDIALSQSTQMGTMQGYLDIWDLPITGSDTPMTWMGHPTEGLMPGMASAEQIEQLRTLPVDEAEVLFLQLMIRHHQGGVEMAQAYLDRGSEEDVSFMAERIVMLQDGEITTMNEMLEVRGESPITDPLPETHDEH